MTPKSAIKLVVGDYCLIPRDDGGSVPFVYVGRRDSDRSYFFGALANVVIYGTDVLPEKMPLLQHALLHIKCFKENNTPIVGNIANKLFNLELENILSDINSSGVGSSTRVWGHRTICKYANDVKA
jgi:hypothetical protein